MLGDHTFETTQFILCILHGKIITNLMGIIYLSECVIRIPEEDLSVQYAQPFSQTIFLNQYRISSMKTRRFSLKNEFSLSIERIDGALDNIHPH